MPEKIRRVPGRFKASTEKALLLKFEDDEDRWVPKSMVDENQSDEFASEEEGIVYIKHYWASKEGFSNE